MSAPMTPKRLRASTRSTPRDVDFASVEIARMERLASEYDQLGFRATARWLRANANEALRWLVETGRIS